MAGCLAARGLRSKPAAATRQTSTQSFTFIGEDLVGANAAARVALCPEDLEEGALATLCKRVGDIFPQFASAFKTAQKEGARFELTERTTDGPVCVKVECVGPRSQIDVIGLPDLMASRVLVDRGVAEANSQELGILRETVATAPTVIWREDRLGAIDWVNSAYLALSEQMETDQQTAWPPARLFDGAKITAPGDAAHARRAPLTLQDGTTRWFDISSFGHGNSTLHYACDASKTVQAEESLRKFMQTLTQTFASLPIGLAIFDRSRQLQLFNPALMELTTLEPEWLAARPTLYDTINRLREKRMLPERKDFKDWRTKISELDKLAVDGTYLETWTLPTGQTYKVTGRPHPHGAVAFLIEDITAEVSLARKFRRELELSQSMFDSLPDATAVFDATGTLVFSNTSYCELWGTDPELVMQQTSILDATRIWQDKTIPNPLWGDVREFVCHVGERVEWHDTTDLLDGRQILCQFVPLTGGATLVRFTPPSAVMTSPPAIRELASLSS